MVKAGKGDLIYKTLVGLRANLETAETPETLQDTASSSASDSDENSVDDNSDDDDSHGKGKFVNSARPSNETTEDRKVYYHKCHFQYSLYFICYNLNVVVNNAVNKCR